MGEVYEVADVFYSTLCKRKSDAFAIGGKPEETPILICRKTDKVADVFKVSRTPTTSATHTPAQQSLLTTTLSSSASVSFASLRVGHDPAQHPVGARAAGQRQVPRLPRHDGQRRSVHRLCAAVPPCISWSRLSPPCAALPSLSGGGQDIVRWIVRHFGPTAFRQEKDFWELIREEAKFEEQTVADLLLVSPSRSTTFVPIVQGYSAFAAVELMAREVGVRRVPVLNNKQDKRILNLVTHTHSPHTLTRT